MRLRTSGETMSANGNVHAGRCKFPFALQIFNEVHGYPNAGYGEPKLLKGGLHRLDHSVTKRLQQRQNALRQGIGTGVVIYRYNPHATHLHEIL